MVYTSKIVLGTFPSLTQAREAIRTLAEAGYRSADLSLIMKDAMETEQETKTGSHAAAGAGTGAVAGGLAGLAIGLSAFAIPGVGPFLVGGPIAAALGLTGAAAATATGAAVGAVGGGILGALIGLGIPKEDATVYEERINRGEVLLAVPALPGDIQRAKDIMIACNAQEVRSVTASPTANFDADPWRSAAEI